MLAFVNTIRMIRLIRQVSIEKLAESINYPTIAIQGIEKGRVSASLRFVQRVSDFYSIPVPSLLGYDLGCPRVPMREDYIRVTMELCEGMSDQDAALFLRKINMPVLDTIYGIVRYRTCEWQLEEM